MAPSLSLQSVLAAARCNRDDFNNWNRRGILNTRVTKTTTGVARTMTRENALELAFLAALTQSGFEPQFASVEVKRWLDFETRDALPRYWFCNPRSKKLPLSGEWRRVASFQHLSEINLRALLKQLGDAPEGDEPKGLSASTLIFIDRGEIVRRVDALLTG